MMLWQSNGELRIVIGCEGCVVASMRASVLCGSRQRRQCARSELRIARFFSNTSLPYARIPAVVHE